MLNTLKTTTFWLSFLLTLALLDASYWVYTRVRHEFANRTVEVAVDMTQLADTARARGLNLGGLVKQCANAGVSAVALSEKTLLELQAAGRVELLSPIEARRAFGQALTGATGCDLFVTSREPELLKEIHWTLSKKCARQPVELRIKPPGGAEPVDVLGVSGGAGVRELTGVCLDPVEVALARLYGLRVICRFLNYPSVSKEGIFYLAALARRVNADLAIFAEEEVLGYQDLLPVTAEAFSQLGVAFGQVEFAKQRGDVALAQLMFPQVVRVHSIAENEQLKLSPPVAIQRFVRAAKERNIRVCYLRFFPQPKAGAVDSNLDYVRHVVEGLKQAGLKVGAATTFPPYSVPLLHLVLAATGVVAGVLLLVNAVVGLRLLPALLLWAAGSALAGGLLGVAPGLGAKLTALAAALTFPTLAMLTSPVSRLLAARATHRRPLAASLLTLLAVTALSLVGAVLLVTLLGDARYLLKLDQFSGIKLAHLFPLLAVIGCYAAGLVPAEGRAWRERKAAAGTQIRQLLSQPVLLWQALACGVVLVALLLLVMRTGNEPGIGVSDLELRFRDWMEQVLVARPRFKEFALGHPALVLAVFCRARGWRRAVAPLLMVATLGQISALNTFCHLHTPLHLSALRTLNGVWLGWLVGLCCACAVALIARKLPAAPDSA